MNMGPQGIREKEEKKGRKGKIRKAKEVRDGGYQADTSITPVFGHKLAQYLQGRACSLFGNGHIDPSRASSCPFFLCFPLGALHEQQERSMRLFFKLAF